MSAITGVANFYNIATLEKANLNTTLAQIVRQLGGQSAGIPWAGLTDYKYGDVATWNDNDAIYLQIRCVQGGTTGAGITFSGAIGEMHSSGTTYWVVEAIGDTYQINGGFLDTANISASATFANQQKAEPNTWLPMAFHTPDSSSVKTMAGMAITSAKILGATMEWDAGGSTDGTGYIGIHINGVLAAKLPGVAHVNPDGLRRIKAFGTDSGFTYGKKVSTGPAAIGDYWGLNLDISIDDLIAIDLTNLGVGAALTNLRFVLWGKALHVSRWIW